MLKKAILKYIGQLKTAEQKLMVSMLLMALVYVFTLWRMDNTSSKLEDKQKITLLENQKDSIQRVLQNKIDNCEESKLIDAIDRRIEIEKVVRYKDSVLNQLRKIK